MTEANPTRLLRRRWVGTKGVPFPYISITHQLSFSYSFLPSFVNGAAFPPVCLIELSNDT